MPSSTRWRGSAAPPGRRDPGRTPDRRDASGRRPVNELLALAGRQVVEDLRSLPSALGRRQRQRARLARAASVDDLRDRARRRLPRSVFDYIEGAAADEVTAARNQAAFDAIHWRPRALAGIDDVELATTVLGERVAVPILAAPTGATAVIHHRGEPGIARAVHAAGSVYVLSAVASYPLEEALRIAPGPTWFQLYVWQDRGFVDELLARASAAGIRTLVLTVDVPVMGDRDRDRRHGFVLPPRISARMLADGLRHPRWSARLLQRPRLEAGNTLVPPGPARPGGRTTIVDGPFDPAVGWDDLAWLRQRWSGPIVVKGLLRPEDARRAVDAGADAVVVSNHGGRQLDLTPATLDALPRIVDAVGDRAEVYLDGGVRRGAHVAAAIALGARACLVGRPLAYGLGAAGPAGAAHAMALLTAELRTTLMLLGCASVDDLGPHLLA